MIVTVEDAGSTGVDPGAIESLARFLGDRLRLHPQTELSVRLVDEVEMTDLHERWMGEPGPTDVLSFPMDELVTPADGEAGEPGVLGDVVLCPAVAARQAAEAGHSTADELDLLLTHGLLHLLGHDHAEAEEHERMFSLQDELLAAWRTERPA